MKVPHIILTILIIAFVGQFAYFYPKLPETIASHFDAAGHANGFSSSLSFFLLEGVILAFLLIVFLSTGTILRRLPASLINLPNKNFWLAPERREETFAAFDSFFVWLSVSVFALIVWVNQVALSANLVKTDPNPTLFWIAIVACLLFDTILSVLFLKRFLGTGKHV